MANTVSTPDATWMKIALTEAGLANGDVPVGSIIVQAGQLIAQGHNRKVETHDPTDHAEIVAIRAASQQLGTWRLENCTIYTTLEPCPMCAEAIIQARISKLVFGAYDPLSGATGSKFNLFVSGRIYPIPEVIGGILEEDCQSLLKAFFRGKVEQP
jgi:tRNA(adenine34) deaminase